MMDESRAPTERVFKVGVFEHPRKRGTLLMAYVRYYQASWEGCCEHTISAICGDVAKQRAKQEHREQCMHQPRQQKEGLYGF